MRRLIATLAMCTASHGVCAQGIPARDLATKARPSVVVITASRGGQQVKQGSGFLVTADGKLVTNRHVIEDADALEVELASGEIFDNVFLVADDPRRDLAILQIPITRAPHLTIADEREVSVGDPVYVMGSPRGWEGTFTNGIVSAQRLVAGVSILQISAPISPGSSGGPVFNADGQVIGVATFMIEDAQNLNMAVPARYAQGMLAVAGRPKPFIEVAAEFATEEPTQSATDSTAASSDLEPWKQVLLAELERVRTVGDSIGLTETHDPYLNVLETGKVDEIEFTFSNMGATIDIAGVCDIDCTDLDLGVYDGNGKEITTNVESSDRPVVTFVVLRPGTFKVRVLMSKCKTATCGYALQAFVEPKP